jgi:hypothetical protein
MPCDEARFRLVFRVDARIREEDIARDDASVVHRDLLRGVHMRIRPATLRLLIAAFAAALPLSALAA